MYRTRYCNDRLFDAVDFLRPVARKHGLSEAECALRWMDHDSMFKREKGVVIIIGASSVKHMQENMVDLEKGSLSEEVVEAVDKSWKGRKGISIRHPLRFQSSLSILEQAAVLHVANKVLEWQYHGRLVRLKGNISFHL